MRGNKEIHHHDGKSAKKVVSFSNRKTKKYGTLLSRSVLPNFCGTKGWNFFGLCGGGLIREALVLNCTHLKAHPCYHKSF
ncbi:hypothetical protein XENTR_v10019187 [Xenopus tropicalis]|nr:hypothetical protein XENTR_v10019187 [Xenopus tropicalis]